MERAYTSRRYLCRKPYKTLLIVCEGFTEKNYFSNFKDRFSPITVNKSDYTDPVGIIKDAIGKRRKGDFDETWCVFDGEQAKPQQLTEAKAKAEKNAIKLCISNPSFELWFLLHFKLFTRQAAKGEIIEELRKHFPAYEKGQDYFDELLPKQSAAISNAKGLYKNLLDSGDLFSNPFTYVFQLIQRINEIRADNEKNSTL